MNREQIEGIEKGQSGMALIDLIVTFTIVALIAGLVFPNLMYIDFETKTFSQQLCSDIRYIKAVSSAGQRGYKIVLSRTEYKLTNGPKILKKVEMADEIKLYYNYREISFSDQGSPTRGDTIKILNERSGKICRISIVPASGRIVLKID